MASAARSKLGLAFACRAGWQTWPLQPLCKTTETSGSKFSRNSESQLNAAKHLLSRKRVEREECHEACWATLAVEAKVVQSYTRRVFVSSIAIDEVAGSCESGRRDGNASCIEIL